VRRVGLVGWVRRVGLVTPIILAPLLAVSCSRDPAPAQVQPSATPRDAQHQGITTPHGDHTPHHGGMVLMNGELHYEVVFDRQGAHRVWFSDAVREDLPASVARDVKMTITRPNEPPEMLSLEIDDQGESWIAHGRPVAGGDVMTKVSYVLQGAPYEIEVPFLIPVK
jgi:hypothetical protein